MYGVAFLKLDQTFCLSTLEDKQSEVGLCSAACSMNTDESPHGYPSYEVVMDCKPKILMFQCLLVRSGCKSVSVLLSEGGACLKQKLCCDIVSSNEKTNTFNECVAEKTLVKFSSTPLSL